MTVADYNVYSLMLMIAVISFLGFILENTWLAVTKGFIDNRNMRLPFLLGYGILVTGMFTLIGTPDNICILGTYEIDKPRESQLMIYFIISMIIVSVCELILGKAVESFCGIEYWNYNWIPLHITKYTSIPTSMGFASVITLFMGKCFNPIMAAITSVPVEQYKDIAVVLMIVMVGDFLRSFYDMHKERNHNVLWKIELKNLSYTRRSGKNNMLSN